MGVEVIHHQSPDGSEGILAIFVFQGGKWEEGLNFLTDSSNPLQFCLMHYPQGKEIPSHVHYPTPRQISLTQEVLVVRSGKVCVDIYDSQGNHQARRRVRAGEAVLLLRGGHGFRIEEEAEVFYVKQGPYSGSRETDKRSI